MPTMTASKGTFVLNGVDVQFLKRFQVAQDICAIAPTYSTPVTFDCSLACTAIGWPMQMGVLMISLYTDDPDCPLDGRRTSSYVPGQVLLPLACIPGNPPPEGVWQGRAFISSVLIPGPPQYGMSFRFQAVMTVELDASVTVSVTMERLVPNGEFSPPPPDGSNVYVTCATWSQNLVRYLAPGANPLARNINWTMTNSTPVAVIPSGTYCETDIHSASMSVLLMPFKIGCNGMADNVTPADCSLDTGYRTYSCMAVLIEPITPNAWPAQWFQMGTNKSLDYRCFNGTNSRTVSPVAAASLTPSPSYPPIAELLNCGCGEDPINGDKQQIQFGMAAGYEVVLKSVSTGGNLGGDPCLSIRVSGSGNPWTADASYNVDATILADTGHYVRRAEFPSVPGAPKVVVYGLEFPSGILAECVPIPVEGMPPVKRAIQSESPPAKAERTAAKTMIEKMRLVQVNPCIHLGEALETQASCGCGGGGLLRKCAVHGTCRVSGNTVEMNCWKCNDYTPQQA